MRHRNKGRKLSRTASHRQAMSRNLACALLRRERVVTTPAKAKQVRPFVERLITLARRALPFKAGRNPGDRARYVHYYRLALQRLQDKEMAQKLFGEGRWLEEGSLAERYADRAGGYTRIIRLSGSRLGVPIGDAVSAVPELTYEMAGAERALRLTGNRLGDNAPQVIFELVEKPGAVEEGEEVAPAVTISEQPEGQQQEPAGVAGEAAQEADKPEQAGQ
jgi:large subunit ribosomal protein L17